MVEKLVDLGCDIAIEAGKEKLSKFRDQTALRKSISEYLLSQSKFNKCADLAEEIDFEGLVEFCHSDTFQRLASQRICGTDPERKRARDSLEKQAFEYAHTKGEQGQQKVVIIVTDLTDLIQHFYIRKIPREYKALAAQSVDDINANTDKRTKELEKRIDDLKLALSSDEQLAKAISDGRYAEAEEIGNSILQKSNNNHPLHGYYGIEWRLVGNRHKIKSVPMSPEALEKYPPNIKITGKFRIGGKEYETLTREMLDSSWRHQEPFYFDISDAVQYLGDFRDPGQIKAESLTRKTVEFIPPRLSDIVPCEIYCGEECFFKNVELRVDEITDEGVMIISNSKQLNSDIVITLRIEKQSLKNASIGIKNANLAQLLQFRKFIKCSNDKVQTRIVASETENLIAQWISNCVEIKTIFDTIEEDIDFLERMLCIEEYLHKEIHAEKITYEDYTIVHYVSDLLRGEEKSGPWKTFEVQDKVSEELTTLIGNSKNGEYVAVFGWTRFIHNLFGEEIEIPIYRFYSEARIVDFEKKCKQIEYSSEGDPIKLLFESISDHGVVTDIYEPYAFKDADPAIRDELMKDRSMIFIHEQDIGEEEQLNTDE